MDAEDEAVYEEKYAEPEDEHGDVMEQSDGDDLSELPLGGEIGTLSNVPSDNGSEDLEEIDDETKGLIQQNKENQIVLNITPNPVDIVESVVEVKDAMTRFPKNIGMIQEALRSLSQLSKDSKAHVMCAVDEHLVKEVLLAIERNNWNRNVRCYAAQAMCSLAAYGLGEQISLKTEGTIHEFIGLMDADYGDFETQQYACEALARFAAHSDNRLHIVEEGGLHACITAMSKNFAQAGVQEAGCHAMAEISKYIPTHADIRDEGGIAAIISGLGACRSRENEDLFRVAMEAITTISEVRQSRVKIGSSGGIGMIIETLQLFRDHPPVVQNAIRAAHSACRHVNQNTYRFLDKGGAGCILNTMALLSGNATVCQVGYRAMRMFCGRNEEGSLALDENAVYELIGVMCDNSEDCDDQPLTVAEICATLEFVGSDERYCEPVIESGLVPVLVKALEENKDHSSVQSNGMNAFHTLASVGGDEVRSRCIVDGAVYATLQGMSSHTESLEVNQAGARALCTFGQDLATAQNIISSGGSKLVLESLAKFPEDKILGSCVASSIASLSETVMQSPDKLTWRALHESIIENDAFPRLIQCMSAFPEDVLVQKDCAHALHMLCKYRKFAFILTQHHGIEAAIGAIAGICMEEEPAPEEGKSNSPSHFYKDGVKVEGGAPDLMKQQQLKKKRKKLKKGVPKALILEHALGVLVRMAFTGKAARDVISENSGIAAAIAAMGLAGGNKEIHHYGAYLLGLLCSDNKANQETVFEEEGTEAIVETLKRYPSDKAIQLHILWSACATCNGHASNQTNYALEGGYDAARKAMGRFSANKADKENEYIVYWAMQFDSAINGEGVKLDDCQFFKIEYENDDEEDEDFGDIPGQKASDVVPDMLEAILESFANAAMSRYAAAVFAQKTIRGHLTRKRVGFVRATAIELETKESHKKKTKGKKGKKKGKRGSSRGGSRSKSPKKGSKREKKQGNKEKKTKAEKKEMKGKKDKVKKGKGSKKKKKGTKK
jgi:hypothetical protein